MNLTYSVSEIFFVLYFIFFQTIGMRDEKSRRVGFSFAAISSRSLFISIIMMLCNSMETGRKGNGKK